jgi:hypothetical protein
MGHAMAYQLPPLLWASVPGSKLRWIPSSEMRVFASTRSWPSSGRYGYENSLLRKGASVCPGYCTARRSGGQAFTFRPWRWGCVISSGIQYSEPTYSIPPTADPCSDDRAAVSTTLSLTRKATRDQTARARRVE